jgi:hypothetical protein
VTVCAQSNVFCSEPPKGGGVSSECMFPLIGNAIV